MKRIAAFMICMLMFVCAFQIGASAGLTDSQKKTLVEFTDKFLEDGNVPISDKNPNGRLQYGVKEVWKTYQMILTHNDSLHSDPSDVKSSKILVMINPAGYPNAAEYQRDHAGGKEGYFFEGDYIDLDCSAFVAFVYKAVLGMHFDYLEAKNGNVRNWSTLHYVGNEYASIRKVILDGKEQNVFEQILYYTDANNTMSVSKLVSDLPKLEVGDLIIGRNDVTGWGHIMFYGGDGYLYHSSSTYQTNSDGSIQGHLMRRQAISDITSRSYSKLWVLRIRDGVLPADFDGWNVPIDFSALSFEKSVFDTTAPVVTSLKVTEDYSSSGTKNVVLRFSDSFGELDPLYVSGSTMLMRSSGSGESGIFGYYTNDTGILPDDLYEFRCTKQEKCTLAFGEGTHYFWVRDAAENVSARFTVVIGETSTVTRQETDGTETLIGSFAKGASTVYLNPDEPKPVQTEAGTDSSTAPADEKDEKDEKEGCGSVSAVTVCVVAVIGSMFVSKRKKND